MSLNYEQYIADLVKRASDAQKILEGYTQEKIDELTAAIAYVCTKPDFAARISEMLVEESGMGIPADKVGKMYTKIKGTYRDMKDKKSVGVIEEDTANGIYKYARPVGVIGAIIPVTNGEATPVVKSLAAIKGRNAIILAPHPRAKNTNLVVTEAVRSVLKKYGAPEDAVIAIDPEYVSVECSGQLMKQCDMILATGGTPMVKSAYSSGTPAIGVGTGNVVSIVDGTRDMDETADLIMRSKIFDNATSCSTENNILVQEDVYDDFMAAMDRAGTYIIKADSPEKEILKETMWPEGKGLNIQIVAQNAQSIAKVAGINMPEDKKLIAVEEDQIGYGHKFSGEKLSPVSGVFKYSTFEDALEKLNGILNYQGKGHSCGLHTTDEDKVRIVAETVPVSRITVNQAQCLANSGAWTNGLPMTMTLGCGTWGNNSVSHNVTWKDLLNVTWVSYPIPSTQPTDEELFPESVREFNK